MEEEGTVADTTAGEEAEATCLEVVTCLEMEGGEVRTVEVAMEAVVVEEWEVTKGEREISPPVEAEVVVEAEDVLWT